jgi:hypothetical protein
MKVWGNWYNKHGEIERCNKCNAPLHWDMFTNYRHDDDLCVGRQFLSAKMEIKKLKASNDAWKEAWFHLREIIGHLWWHHPAITSDNTRVYYQNNLQQLAEKSSPSSHALNTKT